MATDITRQGSGGYVALTPQSARRLRHGEEELAIRTQLANETDIAQGLIAEAAVHRHRHIARGVRAAIDEDPLNLGALEILDAYRDSAVTRIRRFGQ